MESSVRALIDDAREIAESRGLNLPLTKLRNALSLCLFGAHYSAVMAAEKVGKEAQPTADPARARSAAETYRCDAGVLLEVARAALAVQRGQQDAEDPYNDFAYLVAESPEYARGLMAAIKRIVLGVEQEHRRGGLSWAEYRSVEDVHDAFGDNRSMQYDDSVGEFTELVDRAIDTDGRSLPAHLLALEATCKKHLDDPSTLDTSWIREIEAHYQAASRRPPKIRQPERFAINLLIAPNFDAIAGRVLAGKI
jgi:hypothetical protein